MQEILVKINLLLRTKKVGYTNVFERKRQGSYGTEGSNLSIDVESITVTDIKDSDTSRHDSFGISVSVADREEPTGVEGETEKDRYASTVGLQMGSGYTDKKQMTEGSIGNGVVKISGVETQLESQDGDATHTQVITKDEAKETRRADVKVDVKYLAGQKSTDKNGNVISETTAVQEWVQGFTDLGNMVYTEKNGWGGNVEGASKEIAKETSQLTEDVVDTAKMALEGDQGQKDNGGIVEDFTNKRKLRDAAEAWAIANPKEAEKLKNGNSTEQQAAYNDFKQYAAAEFGVNVTDTLSYNGNKVDNQVTVIQDDGTTTETNINQLEGATDKTTNTALINEAQQDGSMDKRVDTNAHEMWHQIGNANGKGSTDAGADRAKNQTMDAIKDEIGSGQGPRSSYQNEVAYEQSVGAYGVGNAAAMGMENVQGDMYPLLSESGTGHISYVIGNKSIGYYYFSQGMITDDAQKISSGEKLSVLLNQDIPGGMDIMKLENIKVVEDKFLMTATDSNGNEYQRLFDRAAVIATSEKQDLNAIENALKQQKALSTGEVKYNGYSKNCSDSFWSAANAGSSEFEKAIFPVNQFENAVKSGQAKELIIQDTKK